MILFYVNASYFCIFTYIINKDLTSKDVDSEIKIFQEGEMAVCKPKTIVLIDGCNLWEAIIKRIAEKVPGKIMRLNFKNFFRKIEELVKDTDCKFLYIDKRDDWNFKSLTFAVREAGAIVKKPKESVAFNSDWDDQEIIRMLGKIKNNQKVSNIVLVTGDGDYLNSLQEVNSSGKKIYLLNTRETLSDVYWQFPFANLIDIGDWKEEIIYYKAEKAGYKENGNKNNVKPETVESEKIPEKLPESISVTEIRLSIFEDVESEKRKQIIERVKELMKVFDVKEYNIQGLKYTLHDEKKQ